jgi:CHAT domain-containing protein
LPWEIVKPSHRDLSSEDSDFLCTRLPISRWFYSQNGQTPPARLVAHRLAAVMATGDLAAVYREWRYLSSLPERWRPLQVPRPAESSSELLHVLKRGEAQLVHFATHGRPIEGGAIAALKIGAEELSVDELVGTALARGLSSTAPFVFMNACHSARRDTGLLRLDGWAERFLELGSTGFLGASWEVDDRLACDFAQLFYEELRAGAGIGYAVHRARRAIRSVAPGNSTWLAYGLYAHPNATIQVEGAPGGWSVR